MKNVLKRILGIMIYLLIPGIFGGVGAGVYFWLIKPQMEAGKILQKGVETTATIIGVKSSMTVSSTSGNTTREERYYYLTLSFFNSEGFEIEYETRSIYPEGFIREYDIEKGGTVPIMYVGDQAVVKGFVPEYDMWLWVFPVVFGAIAVGFLILPVIVFTWQANDYIIKKFGSPATATYLDHKKWLNGDTSDLNSIICTFVNNNGEMVEVKTGFNYSDAEANKLAKMASFPIMYKGGKAVIMIDKDKI
jgi:hypothetical protein